MLNQKVFIIERTETETTLTMKYNQYTFTPNRDDIRQHLDCAHLQVNYNGDAWTCYVHDVYHDARDVYDFEAVEQEYVLDDPNYGPNKGE